jgi:hypothetical protein
MKYSVMWIRSEEPWADMTIQQKRDYLRINTFTSKNMLIGFIRGILIDLDVEIIKSAKGVPSKEYIQKIIEGKEG